MTTTPATPKAKKPSSPRVAKKAAPTPPPMFSFKAGTGAVAKVTAGGPVPTKGCDVAVVAVYKEGELTAAAKRADIDTEGLVAKDYVAQRCDDKSFNEWCEFVAKPENSPETFESVTGVPAAEVRAAARMVAVQISRKRCR